MIYKSCSKCGKIHPKNYDCKTVRVYDSEATERKLRSSYSWTKKSEEIRERANHLCEVCRDKGIITLNNLEVHHIEKIKDDESRMYDNENLICLCQEHHKQADKGFIDKNYLFELAKKREQGF